MRNRTTSRPAQSGHSLLTAALVAIAAALVGVAWMLGRPATMPTLDGPTATGEEVLEVTLASTEASDRTLALPMVPVIDLLQALRRLGAATSDDPAVLEPLLRPLVRAPALMNDVLALAVGGALDDTLDPGRLGRLGILRSILTATALYDSTPLMDLPGVTREDGDALLDQLLGSLPAWDPLEREPLVSGLVGLTTEGRFVLRARHVPRLLDLLHEHPELEDVWIRLLRVAIRDLPDGERALWMNALLAESSDPAVLELAWAQLLALDPDQRHLRMVMTLLDDPELDRTRRAALMQAVASAAEPRLAAEVLGARARPEHLMQLHTLGVRPGGVDALRDEYTVLVSGNLRAEGRRLLVAGMSHASTPELLGIATTDPDPMVRGQALVTATASTLRHEAPDALETVCNAWRQREDPWVGTTPHQVLMSASNLARLGPDSRRGALSLLREIALGDDVDRRTRESAVARLRRWIPEDEHAQLQAEAALPR
tara:strand:- start:6255 stop:7712 length:1458 start_codon:yes stop_codon:yes gene_type:complete